MTDGSRKFSIPALHDEVERLLLARYTNILVEGEVSQLQQPASGHVYLQLRDRGGPKNQDCVLAVMVWRDDWNRLHLRPAVGERVLCRGRLSLYPARGAMQFYANDIAPVGTGALAREIEARKARLMADGLFDPRRKRSLPHSPRVVGVATSLTGAALQDFLKVSRERFPSSRILVSNCLVQGMEAPSSVIRAMELLIEDARSGVIVVTRGGGSKEDLLAFQDEALARFIASSPIPVVSAVGHQIDTTIADLVADVVAPTPSAAAMAVFPDGLAMARQVDDAIISLERAVCSHLQRRSERLALIRVRLRHPGDRLAESRERLRNYSDQLLRAVRRRVHDAAGALMGLEGRLNALSPLSVLDRGYAIVEGPTGVVRDPSALSAGDRLRVRVRHGALTARVETTS